MSDLHNIRELVQLQPDFIGFIFYPKSKRFIGENIPDEYHSLIPDSVIKVGVFVDEPFESLVGKYKRSKLDFVQLHGNELPEYCNGLSKMNIPVIKAFPISGTFDFASLNRYETGCNYFLFDTASDLRGGSGLKFDWEILHKYTGSIPFFLSGGIQHNDIESIKSVVHNKLFAIDVNSGFEISPGLKDISKLNSFIRRLRGQEDL